MPSARPDMLQLVLLFYIKFRACNGEKEECKEKVKDEAGRKGGLRLFEVRGWRQKS